MSDGPPGALGVAGAPVPPTEKEKMLSGELYDASAPEIQADHRAAMAWLVRYNAALGATADERRKMLAERFAKVGEGAEIRPPFHCDYGFNISIGLPG